MILGGLLLIFLVIFFLNFFKQSEVINEPPVENVINNVKPVQVATTSSQSTTQVVKKPVPVTPKKITQVDVEKMAISFAERFGTYSNQANFSNMLDLKLFMSRAMQVWADEYVSKQTKSNNIYYGITTKGVTAKTIDFSDEDGKASILVQTRRREATITTGNMSKIFNQDITINLIKEDGAWKTDSAYWGKE